MTTRPAVTNHLAKETSPYLKQHAHNPVDWFPWGPEALERAQQLDRPIFLSIGYSACHWCHVMEHESFEDDESARILNEHFVSIKVDREERPDLDQIYMTAVQILTGQGGWPMSVFLTPECKPFFGGTYFPPDDRYGRPGFKRVLLALVDAWQTRRGEIDQSSAQITEQLRRASRSDLGVAHHAPSPQPLSPVAGERGWGEGPCELHPGLIRNAVAGLARVFDATQGGFGSAPKFPHPMDLRLLLRAWKRFDDESALRMTRLTLDRMAMGGIYDHLGGGFARYSTDERWLVPHFEKMLYDNALLSLAYVEAYQATGEAFYREIVEETLGFVLREMTSAEGPFYSTLDADSEGEEGKFYVWSAHEAEEVLGRDVMEVFSYVYDITPEGNWEGHNILHRAKTYGQDARLLKMDEAALRRLLDDAKRKLFAAHGRRIRPGQDDKMLTSWNGLMIAVFAAVAQVVDNETYKAAAQGGRFHPPGDAHS